MAAIKDFPSIYWREIGSSMPWFIFPCEGIRIAYFFSLPIYFPIVHSPDDVWSQVESYSLVYGCNGEPEVSHWLPQESCTEGTFMRWEERMKFIKFPKGIYLRAVRTLQ